MKRIVLFIFCGFFALTITAKSVTPAASLPAYYEKIDGKSGKALFDAVQTVTKTGYSSLGYDGLWTAFKTTDKKSNGQVWDMYSDCNWTFGSDQCGSYSNECDCYNREHSIPKSWFGGSTSGPGCDIFHLVPTDGKVNGMRSNYSFGEVSSASYTYDGAKKGTAKSITIIGGNTIAGNTGATISASGTVFEPRDEYKGDFARGYMGALLRWAGEKAFTSGEGAKTFTTNFSTGSFGLTKYGVALLMKWHRQDPVSKKEIDRNNGIQQTQGNRNPFIDYPYLVEYIWGERSGEMLDFDLLLCSADERFQLDISNGFLGEDVEVVIDTVFWMLGDEGYDTSYIRHGGRIKYLPDPPTSCSMQSTSFMGWTDQPIEGISDEAPVVLYKEIADFPAINNNTHYYAVFAQPASSNIQDEVLKLNVDLGNYAGWTLDNVTTNSNATIGSFWVLSNDASIHSPVVDLQTVTSVAMTIRSYYGYNTVNISAGGTIVGQLQATSTDMADYVWTNAGLSGCHSLQFTSASSSATRGVNVKDISITIAGEAASYCNYLTHCSASSVDVPNIVSPSTYTKFIRNGQLLIVHEGTIYSAQGYMVN